MALVAGTVTVADDETATGSGLALALYTAQAASLAAVLPTVPVLGDTAFPYSAARPVNTADIDGMKAARLIALRETARSSTALAAGFVPYFASNAKARVGAGAAGDGLQTTPNPNDPATATKGPAADVLIPLE
jgi:hypothetical protein